MPDASNWIIEVRSANLVNIKGTYAWLEGSLTLDERGAVTTQLGRIKGLRMVFDSVASSEYYNCVEATFSGYIPTMSDLDLVTIYTKGFKSGELNTTYYPRFSGRAESPGAPDRIVREGDNVQYRIVGLAESLKTSVDDNTEYPAGTLLSTLASTFAAYADEPIVSTFVETLTDIENVPYNANYEYLHTILQGLALKANKTGKTVLWGVNGARVLWWAERGNGTFTVDERDANHKVAWPSRITQDYWNSVRYEVSSGSVHSFFYDNNPTIPTLATPDTLTYTVDAGEGFFLKRKLVELPSDVVAIKALPGVMSATPGAGQVGYQVDDEWGELITSWNGNSFDGSPTLERLFDSNPRTYAVLKQSHPPFFGNTPSIRLRLYFGAGIKVEDIVALQLNFKLDETTEETDDGGGEVLTTVGLDNFANDTLLELHRGRDLPVIDTFYVAGDRARHHNGTLNVPNTILEIKSFRGLGGPPLLSVAIQSVQFYVLDTDELDARAKEEFNLPKSTQFRAGKTGQFDLQPRVTITRQDGLEYSNLSVDRYSVEITGEKATQTFCEVGDGALYGLKNLTALKAKSQDRLARAKGATSYLRRVT